MEKPLAERAATILRDNDRGRHTIPSGRLYPHQWAWDSAFAAIGWAYLDLERAAQEVDAILAGQWEDGRIPHIQFHNPTPDYFPGPESWGHARSSTISNPPVWTLAAEKLHRRGLAAERVRTWLPAMERSLQFLSTARDPHQLGCIATCHPWENGQDNCPAWDAPLNAVDPKEAPPFKRVDTHKVEDASQRPTDDNYKRYMALVHKFRGNDFQPANFLVYDPFFTTLTILAEEAQARLALALDFESQANQRGARLRQGLQERLWSSQLGRYTYWDAIAQKAIAEPTIGSLAPALLGPQVQGYEAMLASLQELVSATPYPLPTVDPAHSNYDPVCYWRGPCWVNINWFFTPLLGDDLKEKTLKMVAENGFWEYFDPRTGKGLGTDHFTWTAALVLDHLGS